jgi:hypothetical protein
MLWTIVCVLLAIWAIGVLTSLTAGGLIHLLLLIVVAAILTHMILHAKKLT